MPRSYYFSETVDFEDFSAVFLLTSLKSSRLPRLLSIARFSSRTKLYGSSRVNFFSGTGEADLIWAQSFYLSAIMSCCSLVSWSYISAYFFPRLPNLFSSASISVMRNAIMPGLSFLPPLRLVIFPTLDSKLVSDDTSSLIWAWSVTLGS